MPYNYSKGFNKSFNELCKYSDSNIFRYMRQKGRKRFESFFWIIASTTLFITTIIHILELRNIFLANPTVTTLDSTTFPVTEVSFPGISLCSVNKISKKTAEYVANIIVNGTNTNPEIVMNYLRVVGHFYDFEVLNEADIVNFEKFFDKSSISQMSVTEFMKMLTPPCDKLLRSCYWKGNKINCSKIFQMRLTFEGYCCTFNYFKEAPDKEHFNSSNINEPMKGDAGREQGLTVIINNDPEDYFFATMAAIGIKVHVFNSKDYPDKNSGSLNEFLLQPASENFLEITARTVIAVKDVMNYPIEKRQCFFEAERTTKFGIYSKSDCLVECRIKSMLALCNCIPFFIPNNDESTVCILTDNFCLQKYKAKWNSFAPSDNIIVEALSREHQDALRCVDRCFPSCEGTMYDVTTNLAPLQAINGLKAEENDSIIHIFFRDRYSVLYKQDVVYYWFEIISNFGGMFGLITGFSLISFTEILFHFTYKAFMYSKK